MKNSKKGFTLVELIIVVAVIALLAAVLIPTFSSLISKANQAKDEALVSNLNKAIALSTEKFDTVHKVLGAVKDNAGFDVAKISASVSEHEILWDSVNYCFVYKTEKGITGIPDTQTIKDVKDYQYWQFLSKEIPEVANQKYSIYWAGAALPEANVAVGFDAGKAEIGKITYKRDDTATAQTVTIRTNGGELEISAKPDTVYHYDIASKVVVNKVHNESYHEYGDVRALVVSEGRVVVNEGATINTIIAKKTSTEVIVPQGSDIIVYAPEGATVVGVTKKGTPEEINIDDVVEGAILFEGGSGVEENPYLIATADQTLNIEKLDFKKLGLTSAYLKFINDVTVPDEIYMSGKTFVVDLNGHTVKLEYGEGVKPNNGSVFYIGGKKSSLTINDSSEEQTGAVIGSDKTYPNKVTSAVRAGNSGKLTINGGHYYGTSEGTSCIFVFTSRTTKATVIINGGRFETATPSNGIYYVLNHQDGQSGGCTITVNGGSFKNYNPGVTPVDPVNAYTGKILLGEGCTTTQDGEWYIVSK